MFALAATFMLVLLNVATLLVPETLTKTFPLATGIVTLLVPLLRLPDVTAFTPVNWLPLPKKYDAVTFALKLPVVALTTLAPVMLPLVVILPATLAVPATFMLVLLTTTTLLVPATAIVMLPPAVVIATLLLPLVIAVPPLTVIPVN